MAHPISGFFPILRGCRCRGVPTSVKGKLSPIVPSTFPRLRSKGRTKKKRLPKTNLSNHFLNFFFLFSSTPSAAPRFFLASKGFLRGVIGHDVKEPFRRGRWMHRETPEAFPLGLLDLALPVSSHGPNLSAQRDSPRDARDATTFPAWRIAWSGVAPSVVDSRGGGEGRRRSAYEACLLTDFRISRPGGCGAANQARSVRQGQEGTQAAEDAEIAAETVFRGE